MVARGWDVLQRETGDFGGDDGNVLYLDCDVSYTTVYIQSCILKKVNFTACKL